MSAHPLIDELRQMRRIMHLSQEEVAKRIGWTRAAVGSWESGAKMPPLDALAAYASVFGLHVTLSEQPQIPLGHKVCSRCREPKPLAEFVVDKRTRSGRGSRCKDCDAEYHLDRYYASRGRAS